MPRAAVKLDATDRKLLAKIHILKTQRGLDDDAYRAMLKSRFNVVSSKHLTREQKVDLARHLEGKRVAADVRPARAGKIRPAGSETARKLRALWLSLYNLGVVNDPSEEALTAFVKRQTKGATATGDGYERLQFLPADHAYKAIEALKVWARRDGDVHWNSKVPPRISVLLAQVRRLIALGVIESARDANALAECALDRPISRNELPDHHGQDVLLAYFGRLIRSAQNRD